MRLGVGQDREHEALGVPEGVAVVAGAGEALAGDRPPLGASAGLQHVEQAEAHGLLDLRVALDLDVGAVPEVVEVLALRVEQTLPAGVAGAVERGGDLVAQRGHASAGSTSRRRGT